MAKSRDPFYLALCALRERARASAYASGRSVVIVEEARRLGVSTTPVREALAWLCGEGLIERGPSGGFLAVRLDGAAVRDRYDFRWICLSAGLDLTAGLPTHGRSPLREGDPVAELRTLFDELVRRAGNVALREAYDRVDGQLLQFAAAEGRVFEDLEAEADRLLALAAAEANGALRESLRAYHQRRAEAATILSLDAGRPLGAVEGGGS